MQETATGNVFGLAHLWAQGDNVSHAIAILIVLAVGIYLLLTYVERVLDIRKGIS